MWPALESSKNYRKFGASKSRSDDVFILNDPYLAAIHQSDVYMICPIHFRDKLVGWSGTLSTSWISARCRPAATPRQRNISRGLRFPVSAGGQENFGDVFDTLTI
jgi:hypothetical protein